MRQDKSWTRWLVAVELLLLFTAGLAVAGSKFDLIGWKAALLIVAVTLFAAILVGMGSLILVFWCFLRQRTTLIGWALLAVGLSMLPMGGLLVFGMRGVNVPPIHDVTTDTVEPPELRAAVAERKPDENPVAYQGQEVAKLQAAAYPDIKPLTTSMAPAEAFDRSLELAGSLGWRVIGQDRIGGRLEAVAETRFFGFQDDIVIRIRAEGDGSRVDVRSTSRVGVGDLGANAQRIRTFLAEFDGR